jgi:hypothetical protein
MNSINHSFATPDKLRARYGNTWADMDFVVNKINQEVFQNDPMNYTVGTLHIAGSKIKMLYKDLFKLETKLKNMLDTVYGMKDKEITHIFQINSATFNLRQHELTKLYETITNTKIVIRRKYELAV